MTSRASDSTDQRFFLAVSACFLALVFWTFARTFYLEAFFDTRILTPLVQVHGIVMSGWVVLLVAQSMLVAAGRVLWHRMLGWLGAGWAVLVILLGSATTLAASARAVRGHSSFARVQVTVTGLELVQMVLFAGLVVAAILYRHRPDYHKRLMLLTIACLLPSALSRLPIDWLDNQDILWVFDGLVLFCIAVDSWRTRRLHPAFGWGAGLVLGLLHLAFQLTQTQSWYALGARMAAMI